MLSTIAQRQEIPTEHTTYEDIEQSQQPQLQKQQLKKNKITLTKVLIGIAILLVFAMVSYKVYTMAFPSKSESIMGQQYGKMIQNAGSSSGQETSSNGGSQSTKSSKSTGRPIGVAKTISKDSFATNLGKGSRNGGDGQDPSENNDGDKRKKQLQKDAKDGSGTST